MWRDLFSQHLLKLDYPPLSNSFIVEPCRPLTLTYPTTLLAPSQEANL